MNMLIVHIWICEKFIYGYVNSSYMDILLVHTWRKYSEGKVVGTFLKRSSNYAILGNVMVTLLFFS